MFCVCLKTSQWLSVFYLLAFRNSKVPLWTLSTTQWQYVAKNVKKNYLEMEENIRNNGLVFFEMN